MVMELTRPPRIRPARSPLRAGWAVVAFGLAVCGRALADDGPATPAPVVDENAALKMARNVAAQIKGARVVAVQPNGSMRPIFEEKAFLLVEPASYASLRIGDIVTIDDPVRKTVVVQRILEKRGDTVWSATDRSGNPGSASALLTREVSRVFAIIYANGSFGSAPATR